MIHFAGATYTYEDLRIAIIDARKSRSHPYIVKNDLYSLAKFILAAYRKIGSVVILRDAEVAESHLEAYNANPKNFPKGVNVLSKGTLIPVTPKPVYLLPYQSYSKTYISTLDINHIATLTLLALPTIHEGGELYIGCNENEKFTVSNSRIVDADDYILYGNIVTNQRSNELNVYTTNEMGHNILGIQRFGDLGFRYESHSIWHENKFHFNTGGVIPLVDDFDVDEQFVRLKFKASILSELRVRHLDFKKLYIEEKRAYYCGNQISTIEFLKDQGYEVYLIHDLENLYQVIDCRIIPNFDRGLFTRVS